MTTSRVSQRVSDQASWFQRIAVSFSIPGYRWLWLVALLNWTAWAITSLSQGWLMLQLTDSPFWVGLGVGLRGIAQTLFSVPMGAIADRMDRRKILVTTYACGTLLTGTIAALVLTAAVRPWHLLVMMSLMGVLSSAERPSTSGLLFDLAGSERIMNASAVRFMGSSLTQIVAAATGGVILQRLGPGQNFVLVSAVFLGCVACLLVFRPPARPDMSTEPFAYAVAAGFRYARGAPDVRRLLALSMTVEGFGFAYVSMLPVIARDVLGVGALGLGYLSAMIGVGQFIATLLLASRGDIRRKTALLSTAALGFGILVILVGLSRWFPVSLVLVAVAHGMGTMYDISIITVLSLAAADSMRGRVLGFYSATLGFSQLGGLAVGTLATFLGAPAAVSTSGAFTAAAALRLRSGIRRIRLPRQEVPAGPDKA